MPILNVVISGFDPYPDLDINPSYEVPTALQEWYSQHNPDMIGEEPVTLNVTSTVLPISFANAWPQLLTTIQEARADIIIATGVKHVARGMQMERCATNMIDANKPDADNRRPTRTPICKEGPAAYWTRLPLRVILNDFAHCGIAATLSSDAGTYVCNSLFYQLLHWARSHNDRRVLAGFVSFPPVVSTHDARHGLPLDQQIEAGKIIVNEAAQYYIRPSSLGILLDE